MRRSSRESEFADYFSARANGFRRTAYLILHDWHTAEDLTQVTFVKLYAAWPRVREGGLDAYSRRMLVNECLTYLRRHRRETVTNLLPERSVAEPSSPLDLGQALEVLPARQRAIVALRFLDDLAVAEVADVLGIAEGTVKSQTSRALETLRLHLPELTLSEESR